jgi:hypothetical protein
MRIVLVTIVAVGTGALGLVFLLDVRGISTRLDADVRKWWSAGRVRRAIYGRSTVNNYRVSGVILILAALILILGLIFARAPS